MSKSIYELQLHESCNPEEIPLDNIVTNWFSVIRVPGGWIYMFWDIIYKTEYCNRIFVPYNEEFIPEEIKNKLLK